MIKVISSLKKRNKEQKWDKNVGSYLKRKRLELKQNQDWVAKGICSVSYLSKIENNKTEENPMIVSEIMEKLDVDPNIIKLHTENKHLLDMSITAFYFRHSEELKGLYSQVEKVDHDLTVDLIKLFYYIAFDDQRASTLVLELEQMLSSMDDLNLQVFLVLAGFFYVERDLYFEAYEWFSASLEIEQKSEFLTALSNLKMFELNQRLLKKNHSSNYGLEARRLMLRHHNWTRLNKHHLDRIDYIFEESPSFALKELKAIHPNVLNKECLMHYYISLAKANVKLENLDEAKRALLCIDKNSKYYFDGLVLLYQITGNEEEKFRLKEQINQTNITKRHHPSMIQFRLLSMEENRLKKEYLKKVAIPYAKKVCNLYLHAEYIKQISIICKETSRYKEATQYIDTHRRVVRKTNRFISQI